MVWSMHAYRALGLVALVAALAVACGGDKSGAKSEPRVTLTMQMPDRGDELGAAFAKGVTRRSGGSVRIRFGRGYDNDNPLNEARLARALVRGDADLGYLPARAWATIGVHAFQMLMAPFAVTTLDAQTEITAGPTAAHVLSALPRSVVGVALVPGEMRRVIMARPPVNRADFAGLRVHV